MYAAFLGSGYEDSQVLLALEDRAGFTRSDRPDGARVLATGGTMRTPTGSPGGQIKWLMYLYIKYNIDAEFHVCREISTVRLVPLTASPPVCCCRLYIVVDWRFVSETNVGG